MITTTSTSTTHIVFVEDKPLYRPNQFVRFLMPTSRTLRVGHVYDFSNHQARISFVGKALSGDFVIQRVRVKHEDVFQEITEENHKLYAIDLLKIR